MASKESDKEAGTTVTQAATRSAFAVPATPAEAVEPAARTDKSAAVQARPAGQDATPAAAGAPANPVRRWALIVLAVCALLLTYQLIADRLTPYTNQAYVQAFVVDIAPEVAGAVVEVNVADNVRVKAGEKLFRIDPARFELAVAGAEAALAQAGQTIGASTSEIASAEARRSAAQAQLDNVRKQSARVLQLVAEGVYSKARKDEMEAQLGTAQAEVQRANADIQAAQRQLGPRGANNPQIRAASAELERVRLDLARTTVLAPADGIITNLKLSVGQFVAAGAPVMTFLDTRSIWVVAELPEKSLENIKAGDAAELVLDGAPGRVLPGRVISIAWGVSVGSGRGTSGLPTIGEDQGWLRGAQRFPVLLSLDERPPVNTIRFGSLASVMVYTGDHSIMNALGAALIRVVSWLGYVF